MLRLLIASSLILLSLCSTFDKMGLLVRFQKGNSNDFKSFVRHFTDPLCSVISQFNIVVNNDAHQQFKQALKQAQAIQQAIPINYYLCSQDQQMMKFKLSPESKAQVLYYTSFFINDELCADLEQYLALANVRTVSGIFAPIGEADSSTTIQVDLTRTPEDQIFYWDKLEGDHYSMVEDIRLIHRHLIDLADLPLTQIKNMKGVLNHWIEQIFFNFLMAHFYPQLKPLASSFPTSVNVQAEEQEQFDYKCVGMRKLINFLGYVPVYNQRRGFTKEVWKNPNTEKVIELKKQQLLMQLQKANTLRMLEEVSSNNENSIEDRRQFQGMVVGILSVVVVLLVAVITAILFKTILTERKIRAIVYSST